MKKFSFLGIGISLLFLITACHSGNQNSGGNESSEDTTIVKMNVDVASGMAAPMDSFLQAYYRLKDAFVETDSAVAVQAAARLNEKADALPLDQLKDPAKKQQVQKALGNLNSEIAGLQGEDSVEGMRAEFEMISGIAYDLIKTVGLHNKTVYRTYCPMAFDNKGAYWLSNSATIRNPYFGHKMINCGIVKETLQF